jgi:hypothetical protein
MIRKIVPAPMYILTYISQPIHCEGNHASCWRYSSIGVLACLYANRRSLTIPRPRNLGETVFREHSPARICRQIPRKE